MQKKEETIFVEKSYKDTVFRLLFRSRERLLKLYNALNNTSYCNPEELEITTLENAIYLGMKNDISFVFDFQLYLYEHQSTYNPNMPLRDLFYVAKQYEKLTRDENRYSSSLIKIPAPRFMVFYNGTDTQPERRELKLSDAFMVPMDNPELELIVTMININMGCNQELMQRCEELRGYVCYVEKVRHHRKDKTLEEAVDISVKECIAEGILSDFFKANRAEVVQMSIFEYNQEEHIKAEKKESYADGRVDGLAEGLQKGRKEGRAKGRVEGLTEGRIEGRAEALRESVLKVLSSKGDIPDKLRERILKQTDIEVLAGCFERALNITSVEEFGE